MGVGCGVLVLRAGWVGLVGRVGRSGRGGGIPWVGARLGAGVLGRRSPRPSSVAPAAMRFLCGRALPRFAGGWCSILGGRGSGGRILWRICSSPRPGKGRAVQRAGVLSPRDDLFGEPTVFGVHRFLGRGGRSARWFKFEERPRSSEVGKGHLGTAAEEAECAAGGGSCRIGRLGGDKAEVLPRYRWRASRGDLRGGT